MITIEGTIKNVGQAPYISGERQQWINLLEAIPYNSEGQIKLRNIDIKVTGILNHDGVNFTVAHLQPFLPFFNLAAFPLLSSKFTEEMNKEENLASMSNSLMRGIANSRLFRSSAPYFNSFRIDNNGNLFYSVR